MTASVPTTPHQQRVLKTYTKLVRAADAVTLRMHRHLARTALTHSQFAVLEALYHLGPLCQRDIGRKILKSSGNMTTVIDNLEKRGLAVRRKDPNDRRFMTVSLTVEGRRLIQALFPRHAEIAEAVFSPLTDDELETLGSLLKKLGKANA